MTNLGTIMVVDDTDFILLYLVSFLEENGYAAISAKSGKIALELLKTQTPDLILLDVIMPELDGFDVCQQIKQMPSLAQIPIIFLTALSDKKERVKGLKLGAVDYILKPFEEDELLVKVNNHLTLTKLNKDILNKSNELQESNRILKLANQEIKEQHRQLNFITNNLLALIARFDKHLTCVFANNNYTEVFGNETNGLIGKNIIETHEMDYLNHILPRINNVLNGEIINFEHPVRNKNKEEIIYSVSFLPEVVNLKVEGFLVHATDITKRKKTETELIEYKEGLEKTVQERTAELVNVVAAKDKLISVIAHDLKNFFTGILYFSQFMVENFSKSDMIENEKNIGIIHNTSKNAYKLLENLLEWSKMQFQDIIINKELTNLEELFTEAQMMVENSALNKNILLTFRNYKVVSFNCDKNMINTVLRNLILNAIKYSNRGSEVIIESRTTETEVTMRVIDQGIGINAEKIEKLFKINEKISTKGTEKESGTGIGLILCKEYIEKHKGKLWVESELGIGSVFSFSIPI